MPTVCKIVLDAEEYRQQLAAVVEETKAAAGKMSVTPQSGSAGQITVAADELKKDLPKITSDAKKLGETVIKIPADTAFEKMGKGLSEVRKELNNTSGGAKKLISSMVAGGGALGIILEGAKAAIKTVLFFFDRTTAKTKEAAEQAQRNAAQVREAAEANEKMRQTAAGYFDKLQSLAGQEKLSNVQKAEALRLVGELARSYGDLGVSVDRTTGKITGLTVAMARKAERDRQDRIGEVRRELRMIEGDNVYQRQLRDTAGTSVNEILEVAGKVDPGSRLLARLGIGKDTVLGGKEQADAAAKVIEENARRANELRTELRKLLNAGPADPVDAARNEARDARDAVMAERRAFDRRKMDDAFNAETDPEKKIANRRQVLDEYRRSVIDPLEGKVRAQAEIRDGAVGDDAARLSAEKTLLDLKKELLSAREQEYDIEHQISAIREQQGRAVKKLTDDAKHELEYGKLILAGEYDKAAALRLEKQLREQNLKLTEKQKQALLDQQKAAAAVELQRSLREKAFGLLGTAMARAGRGKEFAEDQALRDAEKTKGSALTDAEKSLVRRLSKLTWDIQQKPRSGVSAEDFARGANELTARGGFIGGAGPRPDTSQIAREARDFNKRQAEAAEQIRSLLNDILRG